MAAKLPKEKHFQDNQLNLFQTFLCNNEGERRQLSNTIALWDSIPRYSISRQAMVQLRDERGFLDLLKLEFMYRQTKFNILIQPALIEEQDKDGKITTTAYYPSANEELIEEALRKLAVDQNQGFYDKTEAISGVVFSMYQLREELKRMEHTRSYSEIKLSLDILARSFIQIEGDMLESKNTKRSSYLPEVMSVSKKDLDADPNARWLVRFHPLVAQSIEKLSYRQFNYDRLMQHTRQLTRWINKLLIDKYTFASKLKPFEIRYSTIKRDSAMLNNYARERKAQEECDFCVEELKTNNVIAKIDRRIESGLRGKVLDIVYTLDPSDAFVSEVKAASKRKLLSTSAQ
jgi:hypothetical protein